MKYIKISGEDYYKLDEQSGAFEVTLNNLTKEFYYDRKYHRLDGPAITFTDEPSSYYINDEKLSKEDLIKTLSRDQLIKFLSNPEDFWQYS